MFQNDEKSVISIINSDLCSGCGVCNSFCPKDNLKIKITDHGTYEPIFIKEQCNECGICLKICPMSQLIKKLETNIDKKFNYTGDHKGVFFSYSNDENIRYNATSGGTITHLLIYALKKGYIDGALVTRLKDENPYYPESFIAKNETEIIEASKSKYCPTSIGEGLKEIIKSPSDKKYAVVGLPCQINAIRNAESLNPVLAKKIILHLGLFCSHTLNFKGTDYLLEEKKIKQADISYFHYRGDGWPGGLKIITKSGRTIMTNNSSKEWSLIFNGLFFVPKSCLFCNDLTNENSDLSFGDPWLPDKIRSEKKGISLIISRNIVGDEFLKSAYKNNILTHSISKIEDVINSQKKFIHFKKINIYYRIKLHNLVTNNHIKINKPFSISPIEIIYATVSLINYKFGRIVLQKTNNNYILIKLLPIYHRFYLIIGSLAIKFSKINFKD